MKRSFVSPSFLKQKARQLKKEKSLSQSQALDEAARQLGFSNYKNYLNISEANKKQSKPPIAVLLKNISSEKDMFKKMDLAISSIINFKIPFHDQLDILKLFQHSDDFDGSYDSDTQAVCEKLKLSEDLRYKVYGVQPCLQFVCEKLNLMKDEIQSYLLKELLTDDDSGGIHDIHPEIDSADDVITKEFSLKDLIYNIDENILRVEGDYNHKLEFDFENIQVEEGEDHKHAGFNDHEMSGSFGVEIDSNKKITLVHSDM